MIDTVILRVHNLQKNNQMIRCLEIYNNNGYSTKSIKVAQEDMANMRNAGVHSEKELLEVLQQKRTGDFLLKTQVGKQVNSSNHYAFTYFINYTKDFIEFNFSIPKYKFGTNILMFVEHLLDRDYKYFECSTIEHNIKRSYKILMEFLKNFFRNEFGICKIDFRDVEINRIDVCFNQIFKTKEDALIYLEYQKRLKKRYSRDEDGVMRDYATSMMYVTKRYSAKVYHKGSEYEKNDMKEHQKINNEKGFEYFKINKFQAFADRMLRYELTIRNSFLNYMHKNHLFRKECPFFQKAFEAYKNVENIKQRNDRIAKAIGKLEVAEQIKYAAANPYEKIDRWERDMHKIVTKLITSRRYFMMEVDVLSLLYNAKTILESSDTVLFSGDLLKLCLERLIEFIDEFQIKELPDEERVKSLIDAYNSRNKLKLPKTEMVQFYVHVMKFGSFKDTFNFFQTPKTSRYRYLQRFKKIGISENSIKPIETMFSVPQSSIDFKQYHTYLMYDNKLLRGIKIN